MDAMKAAVGVAVPDLGRWCSAQFFLLGVSAKVSVQSRAAGANWRLAKVVSESWTDGILRRTGFPEQLYYFRVGFQHSG